MDGVDEDGDGYASEASGGDDCLDADPDVRPPEWSYDPVDGIDNDCDGAIDMALGISFDIAYDADAELVTVTIRGGQGGPWYFGAVGLLPDGTSWHGEECSWMPELCHAVGMDGMELRAVHAREDVVLGYSTLIGDLVGSDGFEAVIANAPGSCLASPAPVYYASLGCS
jgi:hypothetical protein